MSLSEPAAIVVAAFVTGGAAMVPPALGRIRRRKGVPNEADVWRERANQLEKLLEAKNAEQLADKDREIRYLQNQLRERERDDDK